MFLNRCNELIESWITPYLCPYYLFCLISYMIGVYMEWNPKQHPACIMSKYTPSPLWWWYDHTNIANDRNVTWLELQHMMKAKRRWDIINKISNHPKNSPSPVLSFCDQVRYYVDIVISRFDLGNSWPRSQERSVAKVTYETNQPVYSHCLCFLQMGPCILRHRPFIVWPCNFEVKVTAEFKVFF